MGPGADIEGMGSKHTSIPLVRATTPWVSRMFFYSCACFVGAIPKDFNPHSPVQQTWEVLNEGGRAVWTIAEVHPLWTWWPDLFPDICKLAIGAPPGWDLEGLTPGGALLTWDAWTQVGIPSTLTAVGVVSSTK